MAKKRYHQSVKDRLAESRGEEKNLLSRRKSMEDDYGMIHEDHSAVANLPQDVKMKPYPPYDGYMPDAPDDTIERIDKMMDESDKKIRANIKPRKA